jgi:hypothetical protein
MDGNTATRPGTRRATGLYVNQVPEQRTNAQPIVTLGVDATWPETLASRQATLT